MRIPVRQFAVAFSLAAAVLFSGCERSGPPFDETKAVWKNFDGEKALAAIAEILELGPRPSGSEAIEQSRVHLIEKLQALGWQVQRQSFKKKTSIGEIEFVNLRARFAPEDSEHLWVRPIRVVLCSHYDTKLYRDLVFVGADDPGSSMGVLIEAARVLASRPEVAAEVELAFFDGEEAFGPNITPTDGLFGSTYYAGQMLSLKPAQRPRHGILLDMVGDKDLKIGIASKLPPLNLRELKEADVDYQDIELRREALTRQCLEAAKDAGHRGHFGVSSSYITDDHVPLNQVAGIPTIDLIDFDYDYWHTPSDTLDKLSAESLQITGQTTLLLIEKYLME
ncbi:MAG: M28 family peptidase [Verrucomicrobiae bacterium]|nr:M28 family peptidase [Verrucomicrobiae bacterium]